MRIVKVIEVVSSIAEEASGPAYSVPRLSTELARIGADVRLHVLAPVPAVDAIYRVHAHPRCPFLWRLGISRAMRQALRREGGEVNVIHNHGLWMMPNIYSAQASRGKPCCLVNSPRGTLSTWALGRSAWRKRLLWLLGQGRAVRDSQCFHATAESEYQDIRRARLRGPVAIIPNGIEVPAEVVRNESGPRRVLFLGRIHPVKGIDVLLNAWSQLETRFPEWELRIVGRDQQGYLARMQELTAALGLKRVSFPGPTYGEQKAEEYKKAHLFVLPTHSENFGMAVAEALAWGLPAIVTKGAPWAGLEENGCGWWIEQGVASLVDCLTSALALSPAQMCEKGQRGRLWMKQEFSWERVGRMMYETYSWLLGGGPSPPWIAVN
ncbi:MAG TPA: glycosyltransferase [Bryobacteraceae bacterium]